jgi:hypothetical protein
VAPTSQTTSQPLTTLGDRCAQSGTRRPKRYIYISRVMLHITSLLSNILELCLCALKRFNDAMTGGFYAVKTLKVLCPVRDSCTAFRIAFSQFFPLCYLITFLRISHELLMSKCRSFVRQGNILQLKVSVVPASPTRLLSSSQKPSTSATRRPSLPLRFSTNSTSSTWFPHAPKPAYRLRHPQQLLHPEPRLNHLLQTESNKR